MIIINTTAAATIDNTTPNASITASPPKGFGHPSSSTLNEGSHIVLIIVYTLICIVGVIGNSIVCFVLGKQRQIKKGDAYIISLAVADLVACIIWPLHMIPFHSYTFTGWFWQWAQQGPFYFVFYSLLMVSSWQLLLIAIDRYWAITKMVWWQTIPTWKKVIAILATWVVACLVKFPLTWRMDLFRYGDEEYHIYLIVWTALGWILPVIIISILYALSIRALHARERSTSKDGGQSSANRQRENDRITRMFLLIVFLFFIFTIPHSVCDLFRYIYRGTSQQVALVHEVLVIFVLVNSCTNPFIYARMHREVNLFVKRICCYRPRKEARSETDLSNLNSIADVSSSEVSHTPNVATV